MVDPEQLEKLKTNCPVRLVESTDLGLYVYYEVPGEKLPYIRKATPAERRGLWDDKRLAALAKNVRYQWDKQGRLKEVWNTAALNEEDREALRLLGIDPS